MLPVICGSNIAEDRAMNSAVRKRHTEEAAYNGKRCRYEGPVAIPFHCTLPARSSDFEVRVPRMHGTDRLFSFAHVTVTPGYFSLQAAKYQMDPEEELSHEEDYFYGFTARNLQDSELVKNYYWKNPNNVTELSLWVRDFNQFFSYIAPKDFVVPPLALSWRLDLQSEGDSHTKVEKYILENADHFYPDGRNLNKTDETAVAAFRTKHTSNFPEVLKRLDRFNAFAVPKLSEVYQEEKDALRLILHLAPRQSLYVSSKKTLTDLGFDADQVGRRGRNNQFYVINSTGNWKEVHAVRAPQPELIGSARTDFVKAGAAPSDKSTQFGQVLSIPQSVFRSNARLLILLKGSLKIIVNRFNIALDLDFDNTLKQFSITWPPNIPDIQIDIAPALASRLGFPYSNSISPSDRAQMLEDPTDVGLMEIKAKTLVLDTGVVMCTLAKEGNLGTLGLPDTYMASLYPTSPGILTTRHISQKHGSRIKIEELGYGTDNHVLVKFRLHHFVARDVLLPLEWRSEAYVDGVLLSWPASTH